jgi:large subunit ribosomal protein L9
MKVILLRDLKNLGKRWSVKDVNDGYARNYLIPNNIAQAATSSALAKIKSQINKQSEIENENLEKMYDIAETLQKINILIRAKEKDGKLFGSITAKEIVKALAKENIEIPQKSIKLSSPIRELGEYKVKIDLNNGVETAVNLKIGKE